MAFGSNDFPLGPNGKYPPQRVSSYGNDIGPPNRVEEIYELSGEAKLPVTEKDYHSSVSRVKNRMKSGKPNKHSDGYADIDKFRPKYAQRSSLRKYVGTQPAGNNEWLRRRGQRFPGLETVGREKVAEMNRIKRELRPATGMSGVGFFGKNGNLGDVEQKHLEDEAQSLGFYTRRPYR
jgi:hypothetical protein